MCVGRREKGKSLFSGLDESGRRRPGSGERQSPATATREGSPDRAAPAAAGSPSPLTGLPVILIVPCVQFKIGVNHLPLCLFSLCFGHLESRPEVVRVKFLPVLETAYCSDAAAERGFISLTGSLRPSVETSGVSYRKVSPWVTVSLLFSFWSCSRLVFF